MAVPRGQTTRSVGSGTNEDPEIIWLHNDLRRDKERQAANEDLARAFARDGKFTHVWIRAPDHKTTMIQENKKGVKATKRVAADDHITVYAGCDGVATRQADVFFADEEPWRIMRDNERKHPKKDGKMLGIEMSRYP